MSFSIYVIQSKEGIRYTGHTDDLDRRLSEHNNGLNFYTRRGTEWKVIYTESFADRSDAMRREKYLKSGAGRDFLKLKLSLGLESAAADSSSGS
jgi:putative endonuclease